MARSSRRKLRAAETDWLPPRPELAAAAALQFQTPLDVVLYPHPVLRAKNAVSYTHLTLPTKRIV